MMYSLNEIGLIPSATPTDISSRKQVNPFDENGKLPIFASPMTSVLSEDNYKTFAENKVTPVLPRNIAFDKELSKTYWQSVSLQEFEKMTNEENEDYNGCHVLVDIANGHIGKLYELARQFKTRWGESILMVGNIANPNMYRYCCASGIDYVRCGIGGGSVCLANGTKVLLETGDVKNIEDLIIGDEVKTSSSNGKVVEINKKQSDDCYKINNEIIATGNHKFLVVDKKDEGKIQSDEDIKQYAHWIEVSSLDKNKHILVKFQYEKLESIEINSIEKLNDVFQVNDITIDTEHNFIANGYVVHNCSTSAQCKIHSSLQYIIEGIRAIKEEYKMKGINELQKNEPLFTLTKVIADGGVNTLDKAITCLALGYDYVMIGKLFAQCEEACGQTIITEKGKMRKYYGMASEQGQIDISGGAHKNPEGIETFVPVITTLAGFTTKFEAALRSSMSYVGAHNLEEFRTNTKYEYMTEAEFRAYYK